MLKKWLFKKGGVLIYVEQNKLTVFNQTKMITTVFAVVATITFITSLCVIAAIYWESDEDSNKEQTNK